MNVKLFSQCVDGVVYEVCSLVAHQNSWAPKSSDDLFEQEVCNYLCATIFTGVTSAHIVRYFVTVIMYLAPVILAGGLIGPTKSIAHLLNSCNVTCVHTSISSLLSGLPTL
jgi:hypothetical protein